jgi:outer membrane protein assembly factor BamB
VGHDLVYAVSGPGGATFAIRPGGRGDVTQSHVTWQSTRGAPFVPSGILVGDHYYVVEDNGIATCLDARTGERLWQKRLPGPYTASLVATRQHVYFCNEGGETLVVRADVPQYEEVAHNSLSEPIYASPAISQGRLFIRTAGHLACIRGNATR